MDQHENTLKDIAVSKLQRWLGVHHEAKILRDKFHIINKDLTSIHEQLELFGFIEVFEDAHSMFVQENYTKPLNSFLKVLSSSKSMQHLKPLSSSLNVARLISTALMISKFPEQVLFNGSSDAPDGGELLRSAELDHETKNCLLDARTLFACFRKLVQSSTEEKTTTTTKEKFVSVFQNFVFSLKYFLRSFEEWRKADVRKLSATLQESFAQTYAVYVAATMGTAGSGDQTDLLHASQKQLEKIRGALVQLHGPQIATNKIEEICAAVEATYYAAGTQAVNDPSSEPTSPMPTGTGTGAQHVGPAVTVAPASPLSKPPSTSLHQSVLAGSPAAESFIGSMMQAESILAPNHTKILNKLSQLAGIDQERLAYEIVLNPYYRLPPAAELPFTPAELGMSSTGGGALQRSNSNSGSSSGSSASLGALSGSGAPSLRREASNHTLTNALSLQDPASVLQTLRAQMLRMMSDKLINSVRRSEIRSINEVAVGHIVPVFFMPNGATPEQATAGTGSEYFSFTKTPIMSAKVLELRRAGDAAVFDLSASGHIHASGEGGSGGSPDQVVAIDVEYVCDGLREDNVAVSRIVLAGAAVPDPTPLVLALQDLAMQIASFTPNRSDIQQQVLTTVDSALLSQMIVNRALDPVGDLLPILQFFQRSLMDLQAPSRTASTEAWMRHLSESFHTMDTSIRPAMGMGSVPSSGQRRGKSIDEVAALLPPFFERATSVVEEIQRDMANYYITVLVPVLHSQGREFLKEKFQERLQGGVTSLDATASLLYSQLLPAEALQVTVRDLVEAGACAESGFTLADILPSAVENAPRVLNGVVVSASDTTSAAAVVASNGAAAASGPDRTNLVDGVVARAFLALLQLPVRLDSPEAMRVLPETLVWDASRLATMRDLVDRIALECSIVIACKQVMGRYQLPAWCSDAHTEVELQHRLDVLLTEKDTSMASIIAEVSRHVQEALHKFREAHATAAMRGGGTLGGPSSPRATAPFAAVPSTHPALVGGDVQEVQERVSKALKDVVAAGNPVLALFSKRVYKVLLRAMLGKGYKHLLVSYSLQSPAQQRNLNQLLQSASRLFSHTMGVHRDVYTVILGRAVASANA